ncbi:hypothetical protein MMC27_002739 [Xylographa pallens]|nr:hypothetical protein [Xylographa pallens]
MTFISVNRQYGSLARIGPNLLITDDPETTRKILSPRSPYLRAPCFDTLRIDPAITNVVSERDSKKHQALRYKLSAGYSGRDVYDMEQTIDRHLTSWIDQIYKSSASQSDVALEIDIGRQIQLLTVDIISKISIGESFGCVQSDSDRYDFLATVQQAVKASQVFSALDELGILFYYATRISFLNRVLLPSVADTKGLGKVMQAGHFASWYRIRANVLLQIAELAIEQAPEANHVPGNSLLTSFLKRGVARDQIATEIVVTMVAGSESTSTSIQSILLAILTNAPVYRRLQLEIDAAIARGLTKRPVQYAEAQQLPYLSACILEGLRKHPPAAQLRERVVPPEGDYILGYRVPGGTYIGFNTWNTQLNSVFGADYEVYKPERWLVDDDERLKAMRRTLELVFGHGPTKCLGMPLAMMEAYKVIFELLRHFNIATADPHRPWKSRCYGIFFQENFNIRVTPRFNETVEWAVS